MQRVDDGMDHDPARERLVGVERELPSVSPNRPVISSGLKRVESTFANPRFASIP